MQVLRSNEHMAKCGMKEMEIVKLLMEKDKHQKKHCVRYLGCFEHKNHLCIAFEPMKLNMRELLKKYGKTNGKEVGITLEATKLYTKQLMIALKHLKDNQILHADLKPDNILVWLCASFNHQHLFWGISKTRAYQGQQLFPFLQYSYACPMPRIPISFSVSQLAPHAPPPFSPLLRTLSSDGSVVKPSKSFFSTR